MMLGCSIDFPPWDCDVVVVCVDGASELLFYYDVLPHYIGGGKCGVLLLALVFMWVHPC